MKETKTQNACRILSGIRFSGLTCCGLLAAALPALAQEIGDYEGLEQNDPSGQVRLGVGYRSEADIDDFDDGKFSEFAARVAAGGRFPIHDQLEIVLPVSYQFSHYEFSDVGGDPWEDVHIFRAAALVRYSLDDHWSIFGGVAGGVAAESDADFGEAITGGGLVGFNYQASATFSIGAGVGVFSQIEDDARLLPFIVADWQFADNWNLRLGFSEVAANGGYGLEVMCNLNEQWKVGGGIQFRQKRFRLGDEGDVAAAEDGVGEDKSGAIFGKVVWQPCPQGSLELLAGIAAGGEVSLEDSRGHEIGDSDYDPSALIGVRVNFRF